MSSNIESQAAAAIAGAALSSGSAKNGINDYPLVAQWAIKIGTVILGLAAILLGVLTCISVSIRCIFAGIILIIGGFLVVAFEAPILLSFVKCIEPITAFSNRRAPWQKFIIYVVPPPIAIILCPSVTPIFGAIFLLIVAFLYLFFVILRDET